MQPVAWPDNFLDQKEEVNQSVVLETRPGMHDELMEDERELERASAKMLAKWEKSKKK